jgi:hypothetical protein
LNRKENRMMQGSVVLGLWIDIDAQARDECDVWYVEKHIADRIALPGWRRARRFRAIAPARPDTLALYEVERPEQLGGDAYLRLQREADATDMRMRAAFSNVVRGTFRVAHSEGRGEGGALLSLRFAPDPASMGDEETLLRLLAAKLIPRLTCMVGVVAVHLLVSVPELRAVHDTHRKSGNQDAYAHWVLLVEASEADRLEAVRSRLADDDIGRMLNPDADSAGIYRLMYAVSS